MTDFLSWKAKRQLAPIAILAAIVLGAIFYFGIKAIPEATCFDNKKNQGEEGVDCGGPCKPCLEDLPEPVVLWTRFFRLGEGFYEIAALAENIHNFAASKSLVYRAKLYDQNNVLIAVREGETFANPRERFLILEPGLSAGAKIPARALVEFDKPKWTYAEHEPLNISVTERVFIAEPQPHLNVFLKNNDIFVQKNLQISAILADKNGRAFGVSSTFLDEIPGDTDKSVVFSWPTGAGFNADPETIEILIRRKPDGN